jgi:hypothetical protein
MTEEKKRERLYLRSKSIKITAGSDFTKTVLDAACYLTKQLNDLSSITEQPSIETMRAAIMPAYTMIASQLGDFLNIPDMTEARLTGLSVDMNPCLGTYSFDVNYKLDSGKYQPYSVKVSSPDGNVFLRVREAKGVEAAFEFMQQI